MRYKLVENGEWIHPERKYYYMKCCDCGLVHRMEFRVLKDKLHRACLEFRAWRLPIRKSTI